MHDISTSTKVSSPQLEHKDDTSDNVHKRDGIVEETANMMVNGTGRMSSKERVRDDGKGAIREYRLLILGTSLSEESRQAEQE